MEPTDHGPCRRRKLVALATVAPEKAALSLGMLRGATPRPGLPGRETARVLYPAQGFRARARDHSPTGV